jgi:hypothetical protein
MHGCSLALRGRLKEEACQAIVKLIADTPVLRCNDVTEEVAVQADLSGPKLCTD